MQQNEKIQMVSQQVVFMMDVEKIIGRNRLTIRRWWLEGKFPKPIKLNGSNLAWHIETIHEWIEQNIKPPFQPRSATAVIK